MKLKQENRVDELTLIHQSSEFLDRFLRIDTHFCLQDSKLKYENDDAWMRQSVLEEGSGQEREPKILQVTIFGGQGGV